MSEHPWKLPIVVAEIPEIGRQFTFSADAHTRAAIAKVAGVPALPRLEAEFAMTPHGGDGVRVTGHV